MPTLKIHLAKVRICFVLVKKYFPTHAKYQILRVPFTMLNTKKTKKNHLKHGLEISKEKCKQKTIN